MPQNLPALANDEDDKRCNWIHEESQERCKAFHTRESPFCNVHAGGLEEMNRKRRAMAQRRRDLIEDLDLAFHDLQTKDGIAVFLEKVINGVMSGHIKRDKAGILAMFLPMAWKAALARGPQQGGGLNLQLSQTRKINVKFGSPEEMDAFLQAPDANSFQILDEAQQQGRLKLEKKKDKPATIEIKATQVLDPDEMKIPARELSKMSEATDIQLDKDGIVDLFGEYLGDTKPHSGSDPGIISADYSGFGDLFAEYGKGLPEGFGHDWKIHLQPIGNPADGILTEMYKCSQCEKVVARRVTEECKRK